jgi:hypothetical protein
VVLSADPDEELASAASNSLRQESLDTLVNWIKEHDIEPMVLDLLTRVRDEEELWSAVAVQGNVSDETLRVLARHSTSPIQDIIITNQVRILSCLEILEDLKANPHISPVVLRRVREFEEEFIEKAIAQDAALDADVDTVSIEEAIDALRQIGAHIPLEDLMPYPAAGEGDLAEVAQQKDVSLYERIANLTVREKVMLALKGTREERSILINSRNRLVVAAVLASPKLGESEIERFAQSRSVSEEVLRVISSNTKWLRRYGVLFAVVQNPKAPLQTALRLLPRLNSRDLMKVSRDRNVAPVVRHRAQEFHSKRR